MQKTQIINSSSSVTPWRSRVTSRTPPRSIPTDWLQ